MEEISLFQSLFVYVLAGFLIVGLVMAVGAHVLIRRMIVRPLLEAGEIFRRIAEGDLTRRVADRGRNEIGALLTALKSMQDGLVRTVSRCVAAWMRSMWARAKSPRAMPIFPAAPNSRPRRWSRPRPAWRNWLPP